MNPYPRLVALLWQFASLLGAALAMPAMAAPTHIAAQLITEAPAAPGATATVAILMRPEKGWHGYWSNPGDAGLGMRLEWTIDDAKLDAPALRYPVPDTLLVSGLMNHVFSHDYAVLAQLPVPKRACAGTVLPIRVRADWLACTLTICVPERAELSASLVVGSGKPDPRFDAWRAALPAPLGATAHFSLSGQVLRIGIPLPASQPLDDPHVFVSEDQVTDYAAPQIFRRNGDLLIAELARSKRAAVAPSALSGVLRLNPVGDGLSMAAVPGPVPQGGDPLAAHAAPGLPALLLAALLGGLLLNIMPCVFPILSLKALSLARAGESEAEARAEGLAYAAGVITSCIALGAGLLALRAGGSEVGWAFQLQEPGVVAALLLLAAAITANLLGLFEFSIPGFARTSAPQGAFATGMLAAFVATPCTGPFMAAAMGAALLLPVASALALFAALGLGIALPFLAIALMPALRRRLPRPGAWMAAFRRWLALPMGLTAAALLWLSSRLGGMEFAALAGLAVLALIGVLWVIGSRQRSGKAVPGLLGLAVVALFALAGAVLPLRASRPEAQAQGVLPSQAFSEAALAAARASGKPVFAYFTADWCLTCKVNEGLAIEREATRDAFARAGVVVLRGDWTRRDPAITRFLTAQGAAGVPLYMWYPARSTAGQQLPQVLTTDSLIDLARRSHELSLAN